LGRGVAEYGNMGDVAMLQAGVTRLLRLWPSATIQVLTDCSEDLVVHCPEAKPVAHHGGEVWFGEGLPIGQLTRILPSSITLKLATFSKSLRLRRPGLFGLILKSKLRLRDRPVDLNAVREFSKAFDKADLVVICGAGGFFDNCRGWNMDTLDLVEAAIQRHVPVAMLGQNFGPLADVEVLARMKSIIPSVDLLTLRGNRGGAAFIESMGIGNSKFQITGDEAIEMAYNLRTEEPGRALGINMRVSKSAETGSDDVQRLKPILQTFSRRQNADMIPVPISIHPYDRDDVAIKELLVGFDEQSDGGCKLRTPMKVIKQIGRCRVLASGAYHAAVFALSQGIPVVCLAKSPYFGSKFLGLGDQFGPGCETVFLNDPEMPEKLNEALEKVWQSAETLRVPLQMAARRQIESSCGAYQKIRNLLG